MGWVKRVESSGFSLSGVSASIAGPKTPDFDRKMGDLYFGGILGMTPLHEVLLEIDYPGRKVSVGRIGDSSLSRDSGTPYTGTQPLVSITTPSVENATTDALVDTGFEGVFTLTDIASYPVRVGLVKQDGYSFGVGGYWRPLVGQLSGDIGLGTAVWRNPKIQSASENRAGNLIGSEALAYWKLVIDQKKKMLWLLEAGMAITTWTGQLEPDGRPSVLGLVWITDGDEFIVKEVDAGSRAEQAGLKVGDRFLRDNPGTNAPRDGLEIDSSPSRFYVLRGSEEHEIIMALSDPLPATAELGAGSAQDIEFSDDGE
jgi:hypothetical protein